MKILILNWRDMTHSWSGGSEKYVHELAREWVRGGHKVTLVCGGYPGALANEFIDGVEIRRLGSTYTIYLLLPFYYLFSLRFEKFDVIIENAYGIVFFSVLFSRAPKILLIHNDHTLPWRTEWSWIAAKIGIWVEQKLVPRLYHKIPVITHSNKTKDRLLKMGYKQVSAIPPGSESVYLTLNIPKTKHPTILYLGRLRKYKRVDLLLSIYARLTKKISGLRLTIAGTGHDASRIRQLVKQYHIESQVNLKGYVSEAEKTQLLGASWTMVFPSAIEGWGLVALEAAACGTPAVGFNVPGVSEAISNGESGFVVQTAAEFEKKLLALMTNRQMRKSLGKRSRQWAAKFSWTKTATSFLNVIDDNVSSVHLYDSHYFASFWRGASRRKFHPTYDIRAAYITKFLRPQTILDVGCGTGLLLLLLRERGIQAFGVDISQAAINLSLPQVRPYISQGTILNLVQDKESFDTVACVDVLEHISSSDIFQAIKECARIARLSLFFDITCLEDVFFIHNDTTHITKLFSWQWQRIIEKTLGRMWHIRRPYMLPLIHHGIFVATRIRSTVLALGVCLLLQMYVTPGTVAA